MRGKRGKLICEMNQLLIYEKSEKYSVYSPCNRNCLLQGTCLEMAKEFARHFLKWQKSLQDISQNSLHFPCLKIAENTYPGI